MFTRRSTLISASPTDVPLPAADDGRPRQQAPQGTFGVPSPKLVCGLGMMHRPGTDADASGGALVVPGAAHADWPWR